MLIVRKELEPEILEGATSTEATMSFGPLDTGFGHTVGNTLRRVLLSSLEGAAALAVKIEGVTNEFSYIQGVKEDVCDIILNIKGIHFKVNSYDETQVYNVTLLATKPGKVTAGDLVLPSQVSVINTEHEICTLQEGGKIEMKLIVGLGRGYRPSSENKDVRIIDENATVGETLDYIPIDSIFTPVVAVSYDVEPFRIGQDLNYDKLLLHVKTNGTATPQDVIAISSKFLAEIFSKLFDLKPDVNKTVQTEVVEEEPEQEEDIKIEDLGLSVRALNCLKRAEINTVRELIGKTEDEMLHIRNLGAKSCNEIKEKIHDLGYSFKEKDN